MSNITQVKLNSYLNDLSIRIRNLPSVDKCFLYNGETFEDFDKLNLNIQLPVTTVFIDAPTGIIEENKAIVGKDLSFEVMIYILGKQDFTNAISEVRGVSEICFTTMDEIMQDISYDKINPHQISYPDWGVYKKLKGGSTKNIRYNVLGLSFTQKINLYKKNK